MDPPLTHIPAKSITLQEKIWRYRIVGSADQTLVVLSGALGSGDLLARHIRELLPELQLVIPEYAPANSISEFLDAFEAMLAAENVQTPIVYGGSFGGLLAQCWARRNSANIHALILSGTASPDPKRVSNHRLKRKLLPLLPISMVRMMMKIAAIQMTRTIPVNKNLWQKELQGLVSRIQREDLASRYNTAIDFDQNFHFTPNDLPGIKILLLEGSEDRIANKKMRDEMRALYPHAEVITIHGGGHSILLSHPEQWKSSVAKFILNRRDTKETP